MMRQAWRISLAVLVMTAGVAARPAGAQDVARRGRLSITVVDQSGAVIPNAVVTVTGAEPATQTASVPPLNTSSVGLALFESLVEGRYTVEADFPGFDPAVVRDLRVRGADTRRRITLQIKKLDEAVTVNRDPKTASLDPAGSAFSTVLTRAQIALLPDDPDEMAEVLKAMAPPGSVIRVDGFTGGKLPPKSQIRSIRLPRMDMFAAQNHGGMNGMMFIDIMTMPGNGPLRGSVDTSFLDSALNARNAFTPTKGDEQIRQGGFSLSRSIQPNKSSFSINGNVGNQYTAPNILAVMPDGTLRTDTIRQPRDSYNFTGRLDYALTPEHAVRLSFDRNSSEARNLGVGSYDLLTRAYQSSSGTNTVRASENGPIGRRMFIDSRLQVRWQDTTSQSSVELPTLRVVDAFTAGGGQRRGGQHQMDLELASDLDYVRGAHSWRTGVLLEASRFRSDDISNYLGTFTFASLADYNAGRPSNFTIRTGDPTLEFWNVQLAGYVQDDYRITRNLLLSPGIRYGVQSHSGDWQNVSPRISLAWSPLKSGNLTLRGSYGYFYDWIAGDLYKQTLLFDGVRQQEVNMINPPYPDPGAGGTAAPTNKYLWSDSLALPTAHRMIVGIDRAVTKNSRFNATYSFGWGRDLLRGRNLNAPVNGVRPDPAFANVIQLTGDSQSRSHAINLSYNLVKLDWKRTFFVVNYTWTNARTNTTGAFSLPASGDNVATEWGPSQGDIRHRVGASFATSPFTNFSISLNARGQSGSPYNITTGNDNNGDGQFTDRPAGVTRNAARGSMQFDLGGRMSYTWGFGTRPQGGGGGGSMTQVVIGGGGGGMMTSGFGGGAAEKRFRLEVYLSGQNLLNRTNFTSYSFTMTSPLFGQPVAAAFARRLQMGVQFGF